MNSIDEMQEYVREHLCECCKEILDWSNTSILVDGDVRHAAKIIGNLPGDQRLAIVESEVKRQAMKRILDYES